MDHRKEMILFSVVEKYISSAQPVGSSTVVKGGIKYSPATVRAEMSGLEELGLLEQPHASAGRIPTDHGFRYYVDHVPERRRISAEDRNKLEALCHREHSSAGELIAETAQYLSNLSRIVGMVMVVLAERSLLRAVHFREQGRNRIRVIFHLQGGIQEELVIQNYWNLDPLSLQRLTNLINKIAPGRTLIGLRRELIRQREEARAQADILLARAVDISEHLVAAEQPEVFIRGQANLFDLPEFSEVSKVREVVRALEEKTLLAQMLEGINLTSGIRVIIGKENRIASMQNCSVIARNYGRGEIAAGTLGVIGPTRMDYARLISLVHFTSGLLSECLNRYE